MKLIIFCLLLIFPVTTPIGGWIIWNNKFRDKKYGNLMFFILFLIIPLICIQIISVVFSIPFIYAQENQTDNSTIISIQKLPTCERNDTIKIFKEVMNSTEIEQYIKEVENLYNNCSLDYIRGENCGAAWLDLADHNANLANDKNDLLKEVGRLEGYKISFFVLSGILFVLSIILIFKSLKSDK